MGVGLNQTSSPNEAIPETIDGTPDLQDWHEHLDAFVGREHEMALLRTRIDEAIHGKGSLVLISGEPGIGKTRLLTEAVRYAESREVQVLWGHGWERDSSPAFWPWSNTLRTLAAITDTPGSLKQDLTQILPTSAHAGETAAPSPSEPYAHPQDRFRIFANIAQHTQLIARDRHILLVLDDIHSFDDSSIQLLDFLIRAHITESLCIIATYRAEPLYDHSDLESVVASSLRIASTIQIRLLGLTPGNVSDLIPPSFPGRAAFAQSLFEQTAGNPLLLTEAIRHFSTSPGSFSPTFQLLRASRTIQSLLSVRLSRCEPITVEALRAASIIGTTFTVPLIEQLCGRYSYLEIRHALSRAVQLSLITESADALDTFYFRHELFRRALYQLIDPTERCVLHGRLGALLEASLPSAPHLLPQIATHYFHGAAENSIDKALHFNRAAAEQAICALAFERALPFLRNLLALTHFQPASQQTRCEVLVALAEAELRSGRWSSARSTFKAAADISRANGIPALFARAAIGFRGTRGSSLPPDLEAISLLREALDLGKDDISDSLRSQLLSHLAVVQYSCSEAERSLTSSDALSLAIRSDDNDSIALAYLARAHSLSSPDRFPEVLDITDRLAPFAKRSTNPDFAFRRHLLRYMCFLFDGDPRADDELARCSRIAADLRHPVFLWQSTGLRTGRALAAGDRLLAARLAQSTRSLGEQVHDQTAVQYYAAHQFWLATLSNDFSGVKDLLSHILDRAPDAWILRAGLAFIDFRTGNHSGARAGLEMFQRTGFSVVGNDVFSIFTLCLLAEVAFFERDLTSVDQIRARLAPYFAKIAVFSWGALLGGSVAYYVALLESVSGNLPRARELLQYAISLEQKLGADALAARSLLALAAVTNLLGDSERLYSDSYTAAIGEFSRLGIAQPPDPATVLREDCHRDVPLHSVPSVNNAGLNRFVQEGELWTLEYAGVTVRMQPLRGIDYIFRLIQCQGQDIPAVLLVQGGGAPVAGMVRAGIHDGVSEFRAPNGDRSIDRIATLQYKERMRALAEQLEEAQGNNDVGLITAIEAEMDWIKTETLGLFGRKRTAPNIGLERARISVKNNISLALKRIHRVHETLGRHLDASIRTGRICTYRPERRVRWDLD